MQKIVREMFEGEVETHNKQDDGLQGSERSLAELAEEKANKGKQRRLSLEAANILSDEIELIKTNKKKIAAEMPKLAGKSQRGAMM